MKIRPKVAFGIVLLVLLAPVALMLEAGRAFRRGYNRCADAKKT